MTSSSPRKRRTTGWSSVAAAARPPLLALACLLTAGCTGPRDVLVTYFNGDHGVSLRHPASWRTDQAEQEGVWYRYFLAPPAGAQNRSPVSVTLLAGPATAPLDEYAERYLAGHAAADTRADERQGLAGKSWTYASADGATRYRLLLFRPGEKVVGLYAQADAAAFDAHAETLGAVFASFTFERPELYPRREWRQEGASLGVPSSWRETKAFAGGGTRLAQFVSPALATDKSRGTVHASLTVTLEQVEEGGGLEPYYVSTRKRLGDNFQVVSHASFRGGYVDVMRTETPIAISYIKRYYFAEAGRGCSLSFEAREDVFPRASRWADYIASTLRFGSAQAAGDR
jgi:hypothetical protein